MRVFANSDVSLCHLDDDGRKQRIAIIKYKRMISNNRTKVQSKRAAQKLAKQEEKYDIVENTLKHAEKVMHDLAREIDTR